MRQTAVVTLVLPLTATVAGCGEIEPAPVADSPLEGDVEQIDVKVYDMCSDTDCNGCCTANSRQTGFLIDLESYTAARFGSTSGVVEWACLDCN